LEEKGGKEEGERRGVASSFVLDPPVQQQNTVKLLDLSTFKLCEVETKFILAHFIFFVPFSLRQY